MISLESEVNRLLLLLSQNEDTCHCKNTAIYYVNKSTQVTEIKLKWWQKLFNWKTIRHHSLVSIQSEISKEDEFLKPTLKLMTGNITTSDCTLNAYSSNKSDSNEINTLKKGTVVPEQI
jgi:hypothetical protein